MLKKIIIANWKMNPQTLEEAKGIFNSIKKTANKLNKVETIICPPFVYLYSLKANGAQDIFYEERGSFTGEISAEMVKDVGVKYVIIGHSEKRRMGDTDDMINRKIKLALNAGLKIIFCIGEKTRDIESKYLGFIKNQIETGLKGVVKKYFSNIIFAYEPVWAIGAGSQADSPESTLRTVMFIKRRLFGIFGEELTKKTPILYGGSVSVKNAKDFLENAGIQGLLVGRESLNAKNFSEILKMANNL